MVFWWGSSGCAQHHVDIGMISKFISMVIKTMVFCTINFNLELKDRIFRSKWGEWVGVLLMFTHYIFILGTLHNESC